MCEEGGGEGERGFQGAFFGSRNLESVARCFFCEAYTLQNKANCISKLSLIGSEAAVEVNSSDVMLNESNPQCGKWQCDNVAQQ